MALEDLDPSIPRSVPAALAMSYAVACCMAGRVSTPTAVGWAELMQMVRLALQDIHLDPLDALYAAATSPIPSHEASKGAPLWN